MKINLKKSKLKAVLCLMLALICVIGTVAPMSVFAEKSLEDLQDEYNKIEEEIKENQNNLDEVQGEIKDNKGKLNKLESEIDDINKQVNNLKDRIDILNGDINSLNTDIKTLSDEIVETNNMISEVEAQIVASEELMAETKNQLLMRLRESYMAGGGSNLEILFGSDDLSSFLSRKEMVERISKKEEKLIEDLVAEISNLNSLEEQLVKDKAALEAKKEELQSDIETLAARQEDLEKSKDTQEAKKQEVADKYEAVEDIIDELDKESDEYKAAIKLQQEEREKIAEQIDEYIRQHGSTQGDKPDEEYNNDGKMLWPVPGSTRITAYYPAYSDGSPHKGIDIVRTDVTTKGSPFRAAQGGEVIIAKNDGNWNYGFGNYCVIDHGDGTQTLYAHAKTLYVSVGDVVQKGENIGAIGDTGNVTGPHLHFEVRVKKKDGSVSRVQPLDYVSKP